MRYNKMVLAVISGALLLFTGAWVAVNIDDWEWDDYQKFEERFNADLGGINTVEVMNINGSIKAQIGSGDVVDILVMEKVKENDYVSPADLAEEVKLVSHREGNTLVIKLDYGKYKESKHKKYYQSSFEVTLPSRLSVRFGTTNGSISAPGFDGDIELETTNGSITSKGCGGKAILHTTNGSIHVDSVRGSVKAETTNGKVIITSLGGPVTATSTNGSVELTLKEALKGDVELETTNGEIIFEPGSGSSYSLKADTSNGKVRGGDNLDYNRRRNYATGSVGGGKYKVTLETTNGSIIIK